MQLSRDRAFHPIATITTTTTATTSKQQQKQRLARAGRLYKYDVSLSLPATDSFVADLVCCLRADGLRVKAGAAPPPPPPPSTAAAEVSAINGGSNGCGGGSNGND